MPTLRHILSPLALTALLMTGCAKPPTEQIEAAEKAVKEAQESGAAAYTADEYAKLEGMLATIKKEVGEQNGKFALIRDYGTAEQLAVSAQVDAERVKLVAAKKKDDMKAAALQAQQVAQEAVQSTVALVARAPVGKDRAAVEAIKNDAEALKASLNQVQMAMDKEDYLAAQTQAKAIHDKSQAVSTEIQAALGKVGKRSSAPARKK
jgi:hypothetical protein